MEHPISDEAVIIIKQTLIGAGLSGNHADHFLSIAQIKHLSKKDHLITQGAVCNFMALVTKGTMRSYVTKDLEEFNNDFYFEGHFASAYTSFITRNPTNINIEALDDTEVFLLSYQQYNELFQQDPAWWALGKHIADGFFIRKCRREISFLKQSAAERLESLSNFYPGIEQRVSQYHIASYLGIRPESLSRIKLLTYINKS